MNYFLLTSFLSTRKMSLSGQLKNASGSGGRFLKRKKKIIPELYVGDGRSGSENIAGDLL